MLTINPTNSGTLLDYSANTMPDPLQASPAEGNTVYAAISFVVSNGSNQAVNLAQLQFTFPVGTLAQQLTNDPNAILYSASPVGQWNIAMTSPGIFTAVPASGTPISVTTDGIVFQFYNIPVNQQTGTVQVTINETASDTSNPSQSRTAQFSLAKFPYGFFFGNFTAQVPMVQDQQQATLIWQGSDQATYSMNYSDQSVDVTNTRTWTSPALTSDTTFLLRATVISQGETVTRDLTVTVIVANPELKASTLQVSGVSSLQGAVTAGSTLAVNGALTAAAATTINNTLAVTGNTTLASATINQLLTASGGVTTGNLTVSSNATLNNTAINGVLTTSQLVGMMGNGAAIQPGTYTAATDGFITGNIYTPSDSGKASVAWIAGSCNGAYVQATGGNVCFMYRESGSTRSWWWGSNPQSFMLPVKKGTTCSVAVQYGQKNELNPTVGFYWIPTGVGSLTKIGEAEELLEDLATISEATSFGTYTHEPRVNELMGVLTDLFGEKLTPEKKEALHDAIKGLVYEEGRTVIGQSTIETNHG